MTREDLEQLRQVLREENEPLEKGQARLKKAIEPVYKQLEYVKQEQKTLGHEQAGSGTVLKTIEAGHRDMFGKMQNIPTKKEVKEIVDAKVEAGTTELKAEILMLNSNVVRKVRNHERRIENLEDHIGATNPTKN